MFMFPLLLLLFEDEPTESVSPSVVDVDSELASDGTRVTILPLAIPVAVEAEDADLVQLPPANLSRLLLPAEAPPTPSFFEDEPRRRGGPGGGKSPPPPPAPPKPSSPPRAS